MLNIEQDENVTFVGEVTRPVFVKRNKYYIEFKVSEFNNRRVRPEFITVGITDNQKRQLNYIDVGDNLFVKCVGASEEERCDVNAINFAFLLDYRLLNRNRSGIRDDFVKNYVNDLVHGRIRK